MIHATKPELEQIIRDAADGLIALRTELAQATETEWRLCWWSSLAGCGLTLAGLWLGGAL